MKTGAIILAASKSKDDTFPPLVKLDGVSVIRRIIITLKQTGVSPILIITGEQSSELEKEVANLQVITLRDETHRESYMFEQICRGLRYMDGLCDRTFILPAKFPSLLSHTVEKMQKEDALCIRPSFQGRSGHPILLHRQLFPDILSYSGEKGLRNALTQPKIMAHTVFVPLSDSGTILTAQEMEQNLYFADCLEEFPIYPSAELTLHREIPFFTSETARLLVLIAHSGSIQAACRQMQISYSKGLQLIKRAEQRLPFSILHTKTGGASGGSSTLTPEATDFLHKFTNMQEQLETYAMQLYKECFQKGDSNERKSTSI